MLRLGDAYTQDVKIQEEGLKTATHCFNKATCTSTELAELQHQKKLTDGVLDCFAPSIASPGEPIAILGWLRVAGETVT